MTQIALTVPTTTVITSSNASSIFGQSVTFTATIAPTSGNGTVQIQLDGNNYGSPSWSREIRRRWLCQPLVWCSFNRCIYSGDHEFRGEHQHAPQQTSRSDPNRELGDACRHPLGTALSGTQLNAISKRAGTFSYSPPWGTVLTGSQQLNVTFTRPDHDELQRRGGQCNADRHQSVPAGTVTLPVRPAGWN